MPEKLLPRWSILRFNHCLACNAFKRKFIQATLVPFAWSKQLVCVWKVYLDTMRLSMVNLAMSVFMR